MTPALSAIRAAMRSAASLAVLVVAVGATGACRAGDVAMTHDSGRAGQGSTGARPAGNPPEVERVFGFWALRGADGDGRCLISLSNLRRGADYGVQMEACDIAGLPKATGWRPTRDGFELIAGEETLLAFRQTGVDGFESLDGRYVMGRAPQV